MNIYVGNLSYSVTEDQLRELFAAYGEVVSAKVVTDKFTGNSKGFGFVEMGSKEQAQEAIAQLDGKEIDGRRLRVSTANAKESRPRPSHGGGGGGGGFRSQRNNRY
ncbi:MAG: RNA-binding protein [Candidatus Babeliales bacterium]